MKEFDEAFERYKKWYHSNLLLISSLYCSLGIGLVVHEHSSFSDGFSERDFWLTVVIVSMSAINLVWYLVRRAMGKSDGSY